MATFIHERMKFFFIHVPKTGGMTVSNFFFDGSASPQRLAYSKKNEQLGIHTGIERVSRLLGDEFEDYFSFAYYRNTWDWSFSLYRYIKRTPSHPKYEAVHQLSFEEYVFQIAEDFFRPQKPLVAQGNEIRVTQLDDYQNFADSFGKVLNNLGYENSHFKSHNRATAKDYRSVYDKKMMIKIGDIYEEDIEFFGFDF
ncbi:MAG: sulfotransferase family 2 domain-containing protein [Pseudomonadales bacterium]